MAVMLIYELINKGIALLSWLQKLQVLCFIINQGRLEMFDIHETEEYLELAHGRYVYTRLAVGFRLCAT